MPFHIFLPKFRSRAAKGKLIIGLGGAAAAWAAIHIYRSRTRLRGSIPESSASDWVAEKEPGGPFSAEEPGSGTESWVESLQQAMDRKPFAVGYDKSVWTAPLLCRFLEETHGVKVPLPRVRGALKDLGYHWKYSRYVRAGNGQPHAQSAGLDPLP
ncbi:MAG: winged helix-turn-helix domain-containing protein [Fibrobacterota bacterium]|nr:winged helix-turn-helix domain-containing protein [Fibrobacterota bacterium]